MQITPEQALAEAANMALELRLKDRALAKYEQDIAILRAKVTDLETQLGEKGTPGNKQIPATGQQPPVGGDKAARRSRTDPPS